MSYQVIAFVFTSCITEPVTIPLHATFTAVCLWPIATSLGLATCTHALGTYSSIPRVLAISSHRSVHPPCSAHAVNLMLSPGRQTEFCPHNCFQRQTGGEGGTVNPVAATHLHLLSHLNAQSLPTGAQQQRHHGGHIAGRCPRLGCWQRRFGT